jgi:hypothetical protein
MPTKSSIYVHKGVVESIEYFDTSKNGNPRRCVKFRDNPTKFYTEVDSMLGYALSNAQAGDQVLIGYRALRGKQTITSYENPSDKMRQAYANADLLKAAQLRAAHTAAFEFAHSVQRLRGRAMSDVQLNIALKTDAVLMEIYTREHRRAMARQLEGRPAAPEPIVCVPA